MSTQMAEVVHVSIATPPRDLITFLSDMNNWKSWALWIRSVKRNSARRWTLDTEAGRMKFRFIESDLLGVLDHEVTLASGVTVLNTLRVFSNDTTSELVMVVFRLPNASTEDFKRDVQAVRDDLARVKSVIESTRG